MLKEFIQHIQETTQPLVKEIDGETFAIMGGGSVTQIREEIDRPETLTLHSLDALINMVKSEAVLSELPLYITVPTHLTARCFGSFRSDERCFRQTYYEASATDVPGFSGGFREHENAIIELRSRFVPNDGTAYLLDLLSRVNKDSSVSTSDNGVSQTVEARTGVSLKSLVPVNPIVALRPYRTFQEVEQPESDFLLRLDSDGRIGLFEADGGMWKLQARQSIAKFLTENLREEIEGEKVIVAL